jgi:cytochrome P450
MVVTAAELQALPLFDGCAADDVRPVMDAISGARAPVEGEVICTEGDEADRWWIVVDGLADVTIRGVYIDTIGPGETIGELALLDGEPRAATVTASTDMQLHEVDGKVFLDVLLASPRLSVALLRELATRLRAANLRPPLPSPAVPAAVTRRPPSPATTVEQPTEFDPRTRGYVEDPAIHLAGLREAAAVHWSEAISSFVITRYEDVHRLSRSRSLIGSITTLEVPDVPDPDGSMPRPQPGHRMMIRKDGEDHLRLRRLVSKVFTPRAISQWQARAESIVERLLAAADERTEVDVIADYALPLPAQVISEMLGMPPDDTPTLRAWSRTLAKGLDPFSTPEEEDASAQAGRAMTMYLEQVLADKRALPGDDILTALLNAEEAGDVLDDNEVIAQVVLLYIAGHETTLNLIGNGITHLFRFPDQLERLRTEPGLDANAVEEVLRFESPAQLTRRVNLEPVEIGDVEIPAGSHITLCLASANRDPRKWGDTADTVDIARPGANEHVSFGGGSHFCLGAALARLEGKIALPRLVRRFPKMAPAYDEPAWAQRVTLRGVESLPVTLR